MTENCFKCKKVISAEQLKINCSNEECLKKAHRSCVDIDEAVFEAISNHPFIKFNCGECVDRFKALHGKVQTVEEKMNRLCAGMSQLQTRLFQQSLTVGHNNVDGKKFPNHNNNNNHLMVVGSNVTSSRLKVVCDFGRWVQVGKFATSTTEEDIIDYLADALQLSKNKVKCTKLVKNDANLAQLSYCKFKISIPDHRFNELFNESIWPSGVMVSPFTPRSQLNYNRM